jgi:hypothetical protein
MSARFSFGRQPTDASTSTAASGSSVTSSTHPFVKGRAMSWRDKKQRIKESSLVEEYYSMYELDWAVLREWLQTKYPGIDFKEAYVRDPAPTRYDAAILGGLALTPRCRTALVTITSSRSRKSSARLVLPFVYILSTRSFARARY